MNAMNFGSLKVIGNETCNLECCTDEYGTRMQIKKAKEAARPIEQVYELDEPIKVFLFDVPKAQYAKRNMISAIYPLTNVFLGFMCTVLFLFPFEGAHQEFSITLHVPFSTFGMIYHATPGMMAINKFFDSSHVLKWVHRRSEHAMQMAVAFLFLFLGLGLFAWKGEPDYETIHAEIGMAAAAANILAILSGFVACLVSRPGPLGARVEESICLYLHAYIGILTYAIFIITFVSGLKTPLREWLESLFGYWTCLLFIVIAIFLFIVSLIGPYLRLQVNRETAKFKRNLKNKKKREENIKKKREKLAKLGITSTVGSK